MTINGLFKKLSENFNYTNDLIKVVVGDIYYINIYLYNYFEDYFILLVFETKKFSNSYLSNMKKHLKKTGKNAYNIKFKIHIKVEKNTIKKVENSTF